MIAVTFQPRSSIDRVAKVTKKPRSGQAARTGVRRSIVNPSKVRLGRRDRGELNPKCDWVVATEVNSTQNRIRHQRPERQGLPVLREQQELRRQEQPGLRQQEPVRPGLQQQERQEQLPRPGPAGHCR
jgi:hypothetical protein